MEKGNIPKSTRLEGQIIAALARAQRQDPKNSPKPSTEEEKKQFIKDVFLGKPNPQKLRLQENQSCNHLPPQEQNNILLSEASFNNYQFPILEQIKKEKIQKEVQKTLGKSFPIVEHQRKNNPKNYKKITELASKILSRLNHQTTDNIVFNPSEKVKNIGNTKESSEEEKMKFALKIAQIFFNKADRVDKFLDKEPTIFLANTILNGNKQYIEGRWVSNRNLLFLATNPPADKNGQKLDPTIHEAVHALESSQEGADGLFEDWSEQSKKLFIKIEEDLKKQFKANGNKLYGLHSYAFVKPNGEEHMGMHEFTAVSYEYFILQPALLKEHQPELYNFIKEDLGFDPADMLNSTK